MMFVNSMSDLMILIALDIVFHWFLMGAAMAVLLWAGLNFARFCEWLLNKITRKTS